MKKQQLLGFDGNKKPVMLTHTDEPSPGSETKKLKYHQVLVSLLVRKYMGMMQKPSKHAKQYAEFKFDRPAAKARAKVARKARRLNRQRMS